MTIVGNGVEVEESMASSGFFEDLDLRAIVSLEREREREKRDIYLLVYSRVDIYFVPLSKIEGEDVETRGRRESEEILGDPGVKWIGGSAEF